MRLCTFEAAGAPGCRRLGAVLDGRIIDLHSAEVWYLAQSGEPDPEPLAAALVPAGLPDFLRAGLRATHSADELFGGAGPHPADWWRASDPPRGIHGEKTVYLPPEVRIAAPLGHFAGPEESVDAGGAAECEVCLAAIAGVPRHDLYRMSEALRPIAGYTILARFGQLAAMGPVLTTCDEAGDPYNLKIKVRVNGDNRALFPCHGVEPRFEEALAAGAPAPGTVLAAHAGRFPIRAGDTVEIEIDRVGVLRNRVL